MEAMAQTGSKKLTKRMVQEIASSFSEELSPGFSKEVLEEISSAAHVTMFADRVAFVNTLQRHREEFDSLLQHMSESYKALFADVGKRPLWTSIWSCSCVGDKAYGRPASAVSSK